MFKLKMVNGLLQCSRCKIHERSKIKYALKKSVLNKINRDDL